MAMGNASFDACLCLCAYYTLSAEAAQGFSGFSCAEARGGRSEASVKIPLCQNFLVSIFAFLW
jgi:hypothetical protein